MVCFSRYFRCMCLKQERPQTLMFWFRKSFDRTTGIISLQRLWNLKQIYILNVRSFSFHILLALNAFQFSFLACIVTTLSLSYPLSCEMLGFNLFLSFFFSFYVIPFNQQCLYHSIRVR